jgi:hypothetical protein
VTLTGELMFLLKVPKEKIYGLMRRLVTFHLRKNGLYEGKDGNRTGKINTGSLYRKDNIVFFHCIIPCVKSRRKLYLPDNVPANEFLNLEGNKLSTSKKLGSLAA